MPWDSDVDSISDDDDNDNNDDDDDQANARLTPYWPKYPPLFAARGLHLDTVRDVRPYYSQLQSSSNCCIHSSVLSLLNTKEGSQRDLDLFPDPSLPDNLFRGQRTFDGKRFVVKAVHSCSREYDAVRFLSCPTVRNDPMNHTIPIMDIFECQEDHVAFIVMEQWSPQLFADFSPCCSQEFLLALRAFIEHIVFMHKHHFVHFDISIRNIVTNQHGSYAFIDFELSRSFQLGSSFRARGHATTEIPPECETREFSDPFKADVWALGVLILRACKMSGCHLPELLHFTRPMLHEVPEQRPTAHTVLETFNKMMGYMRPRLKHECSNNNH